jgi:hypothetical protein
MDSLAGGKESLQLGPPAAAPNLSPHAKPLEFSLLSLPQCSAPKRQRNEKETSESIQEAQGTQINTQKEIILRQSASSPQTTHRKSTLSSPSEEPMESPRLHIGSSPSSSPRSLFSYEPMDEFPVPQKQRTRKSSGDESQEQGKTAYSLFVSRDNIPDKDEEEDSRDSPIQVQRHHSKRLFPIGSIKINVCTWTYRFQKFVRAVAAVNMDTPLEDVVAANTDLMNLSDDFVHASRTFGKIIISEVFLPAEQKTIQPMNLGGIVGGKNILCTIFSLNSHWITTESSEGTIGLRVKCRIRS